MVGGCPTLLVVDVGVGERIGNCPGWRVFGIMVAWAKGTVGVSSIPH